MVHFPAILVFCSFTFTPDVKGVQGPMTKCDQKITTEKKKQKKTIWDIWDKKESMFFLKYEVFHPFLGGRILLPWDLVKLAMGVSHVQAGCSVLQEKQRAC